MASIYIIAFLALAGRRERAVGDKRKILVAEPSFGLNSVLFCCNLYMQG